MVSLGLFGRSTEPGVHQKQVNGGEDLVSSNDLSLILHLQIHTHHHRLWASGPKVVLQISTFESSTSSLCGLVRLLSLGLLVGRTVRECRVGRERYIVYCGE